MGVRVILSEMRRLSQGETVFLMGDFNSPFRHVPDGVKERLIAKACGPRISASIDKNPVVETLNTLYDTLYRTETPHEGPENTFSGYKPSNLCRIDYVFTTGNVRVLRHVTCSERPDGRHPSDHDAVMASIVIK